MQWEASEFAGFSDVKPWLPVNPNKKEINVATEKTEDHSVLSFYKKMIALRKTEVAFVEGSFEPYLAGSKTVFAYTRTLGEESFLILVNMSEKAAQFDLPTKIANKEWEVVLQNTNFFKNVEKRIRLDAYDAFVYKLGGNKVVL
jgi:glycosidase